MEILGAEGISHLRERVYRTALNHGSTLIFLLRWVLGVVHLSLVDLVGVVAILSVEVVCGAMMRWLEESIVLRLECHDLGLLPGSIYSGDKLGEIGLLRMMLVLIWILAHLVHVSASLVTIDS